VLRAGWYPLCLQASKDIFICIVNNKFYAMNELFYLEFADSLDVEKSIWLAQCEQEESEIDFLISD
jgi:hypothetical protein